MLDEHEYTYFHDLYVRCHASLGEYLVTHDGHPPEAAVLEDLFRPMLDEFERLTGRRDLDPKEIIQHGLADYGPPCSNCGRPLRSPTAPMCFECGTPRGVTATE
jgi:hypothetical protein